MKLKNTRALLRCKCNNAVHLHVGDHALLHGRREEARQLDSVDGNLRIKLRRPTARRTTCGC